MIPWWLVLVTASAAEAPQQARDLLRAQLQPAVRATRRRSDRLLAEGKTLHARREWEILRDQRQRERDAAVHAMVDTLDWRAVLANAPYLYHVTSPRLHPTVQAQGLRPREWDGNLFLTTWEGLPMWVPWRRSEEWYRQRRTGKNVDLLPRHDDWMRVYRVPTTRVRVAGVDSGGTKDAIWSYCRGRPVEGFPWPVAARTVAVVTQTPIPPTDLETARARMVDWPDDWITPSRPSTRELQWDGPFRPVAR